MNPALGWALAVLALVAGWHGWRWQGVVLALTVIAFWLILQFNRALRVMRAAAAAPIGHVASAVMLSAKLARGMALWQIVALTRSLGRPQGGSKDSFAWVDPGGAEVVLTLKRGRLTAWQLRRPMLLN